MKKEKEISEKIKKIFSKVVIVTCTMCGKFISDEEAKQFEGVCKNHWDE